MLLVVAAMAEQFPWCRGETECRESFGSRVATNDVDEVLAEGIAAVDAASA